MRTKQEIAAEIQALKLIQPSTIVLVLDPNLFKAMQAGVNAQIKVLEENMTYYEIYEYYDSPNFTDFEISAALTARDWVIDEEAYAEGLAATWSNEEATKVPCCDLQGKKKCEQCRETDSDGNLKGHAI